MNSEDKYRNWTAAELKAYHLGELSDAERHALEADSLEDPFLADALEGASGIDVVKGLEEMQGRWDVLRSDNGEHGSIFSWRGVIFTVLIISTIWMLWTVWSSQNEITELSQDLAKDAEEHEVQVYRYQDSLEILEISLAQAIPVQEQISASSTSKEQHERDENKHEEIMTLQDDANHELEFLESIDPISYTQVNRETEKELKVKTFPTLYVNDLKVADYRTRHIGPEFIMPGLLTGTPAAMGNRKATADKEQIQLSYQELLTNALRAFTIKDYKNCLVMLDRIAETYPRDENAKFYSALCYYNLGKWDRAEALFRASQYHENGVFSEEGEFYRALTKLRTGDEQEANRLFRSIVEQKSFYAERARGYLTNRALLKNE